ncbi:hypothetical protein ERUR111494_00100 [Erysipelothrix urinaevulpis]|uniref:hypothetical protein n=1 Tax=Erysipelothrix urinaevulpis TaxID=2683717 RepID=UPI00135B7491|nr:hypothetical protein [Erysipelothrix urinaevulpis]
MKKYRLIYTVLLSIFLILPKGNTLIEAESSKEVDLEVLVDEKVDTPFSSGKDGGPVTIFDVSFGIENNQQVAYTASKGSGDYGAIFNVINVDTGENLFNAKMEGATQVWSIITVEKDVYIGTTGRQAGLWRYNSVTKEVMNLGNPLPGLVTLFTLTSDGKKVYGGGHPTGKLFAYDIKSNSFENLGVVDVGIREEGISNLPHPEDYVRSSAIYKDELFVGTGSQNGRILKKNISNDSQWELIEMPIARNIEEFKSLQFAYDLKIVRNYLFAFFNGNRTVYIYDLEKQVWLDTKIPNIRGQVGVSSEYKEHVYFSSNDKNMYRFNLNTMTVDETPLFDYDANLRNSQIITKNNRDVLMSIEFDGKLRIFDFNDGFKKDTLQTDVHGQPQAIQSMFYDRNTDNLFASAYQGAQGYRRKLSSGHVDKFKLGQIENMDVLDGTVYFGEYPAARVFTMKSDAQDLQVKEQFNLTSDKQDRPFKMHAHDKKMYIGTIGDYGVLDGALGIYDPSTDNLKVHKGLIPNQSIVGIAVKDNLVYGSTSIHGGLGIEPTETTAKLFIFDTITEEIVLVREIEELAHQKVSMISGLSFDETGKLWASANGSLFELDPDDLSVKRMKTIYPSLESYGKWRPIEINFIDDRIYANVGGIVNLFNRETLENVELVTADKYIVTNDHKVYYADQVDIRSMEFKLHEKEFLSKELFIENHSFEKHQDLIPVGWEPYYSVVKDNTNFSINTEYKTDGESSLHVYDRDGSGSMFVRSSLVEVKENAEYNVSVDHYLMNGKATMMLRFYDDDGEQIGKDIGNKSIIHTSGDYNKWNTYQLNGNAPKGATHLRVSLGTNNAAQTDGALFDNVRVFEKSEQMKTESTITIRHQYLNFDGKVIDEDVETMTQNIGEKLAISYKEREKFAFNKSKEEDLSDIYFDDKDKEIIIQYKQQSTIIINHHYIDKKDKIVKTESQVYHSDKLNLPLKHNYTPDEGYEIANSNIDLSTITFKEKDQSFELYYNEKDLEKSDSDIDKAKETLPETGVVNFIPIAILFVVIGVGIRKAEFITRKKK